MAPAMYQRNKILFIVLLLLYAMISKGQVYQLMPQYGYDAKRMKFDSTLQIPTFCGIPSLNSNITKRAAIAFDSCNKRFYFYNPKLLAWDTIKGGGSFDTSSLSSRINAKVDSVKKNSDSVYYWKNGVKYFAFKDSFNISLDTSSLSNRINKKIDSIYRNSINVYFVKNGISSLAYTDSIGNGKSGRFGNDTANVVMAKVHNDAGVTLTNGKVVYLGKSGTSSDAPSVKLAANKGDSTSANTFGFVSGTIAINDTGWIILSGKIEKLNTSAFSNGDIIYLDSVAGQYTKTKPKAPYHLVYLGVVVKANAGNGAIFVKPQNGYELDEVHDCLITSPTNNQILVYSDTQKVWKNKNAYSVIDTTSLSNRINGLNLQKITDAGNTTSNDIYTNSYFIFDPANNDYGKIELSDGYFYFNNVNGNTIFSNELNDLSIWNDQNKTATIASIATQNRSYILPDTSGTFAVRGDSTIFQTKYRIDSARTNIYNAINIRVKYADTSTMLSPYLKSNTAAATYQPIGSYATTTQLNTKLNSSDSTIYQTKYRSDTARTNIYNALNGKQASLNGTGFIKASGNTISYDNSTYITDDAVMLGYQAMGSTIKGKNLICYSPHDVVANVSLSNTTAYFYPYYLQNAATITGIKWWQGAVSTSNAGTYNGFALYSVSGGTLTLVASSTNDTTNFKSGANSWKSKAFSSTYSASAGLYYVSALFTTTGASLPNIGGAASVSGFGGFGSVDFTNNNKMAGSVSTSSFPSSQALSGVGGFGGNYHALFLY